MKSLVALHFCPDYEPGVVENAVKTVLDATGGIESVVREGSRVFCKINLLVPAKPERAVSTHPEIVRAVIRAIRRVGGIPVVGDNPAIAKTVTALRKSGILAVLEEEKVEFPDLTEVVRIENPNGCLFRSFVYRSASTKKNARPA